MTLTIPAREVRPFHDRLVHRLGDGRTIVGQIVEDVDLTSNLHGLAIIRSGYGSSRVCPPDSLVLVDRVR